MESAVISRCMYLVLLQFNWKKRLYNHVKFSEVPVGFDNAIGKYNQCQVDMITHILPVPKQSNLTPKLYKPMWTEWPIYRALTKPSRYCIHRFALVWLSSILWIFFFQRSYRSNNKGKKGPHICEICFKLFQVTYMYLRSVCERVCVWGGGGGGRILENAKPKIQV